MFQVHILPEVSVVLGTYLGREAMLAVLTRLRDELENNAARYRPNRDPKDPDCLFDYPLKLWDGSRWHRFRFSVNDTTAAGRLFVEAVTHQ